MTAIITGNFAIAGERIYLDTYNAKVAVPIRSWKTLRDARIVKQDLDFSCGAASLATILNSFYKQTVNEKILLEAMDKGNFRASFDDMARMLPKFGFHAIGYAVSFEQLIKLKIPVVVYLKYRKDDHFSVLRGIDANTVWLADSALGNRYYSRSQFLNMWETRGDASLKGKILAVLPVNQDSTSHTDFFTANPKRPTALTTSLQSIRYGPS